MKKRAVALLVVVNLALGLGLWLSRPPAAKAQAGSAGRGDYLMLSGLSTERPSLDMIYVLDLRQRRMVSFFYDEPANRIDWQVMRALTQDRDQPVVIPQRRLNEEQADLFRLMREMEARSR